MPPIRALPAPRGDCRGRPGFVDVALRNGHVIEASQHGHLRSLASKHSHLHRESWTMKSSIAPAAAPVFSLLIGFASVPAFAQTPAPQAASPYTLRVVSIGERFANIHGRRALPEINSSSMSTTGIIPAPLKRSRNSRSAKGLFAGSCWWAYSAMSRSTSTLPVT